MRNKTTFAIMERQTEAFPKTSISIYKQFHVAIFEKQSCSRIVWFRWNFL